MLDFHIVVIWISFTLIATAGFGQARWSSEGTVYRCLPCVMVAVVLGNLWIVRVGTLRLSIGLATLLLVAITITLRRRSWTVLVAVLIFSLGLLATRQAIPVEVGQVALFPVLPVEGAAFGASVGLVISDEPLAAAVMIIAQGLSDVGQVVLGGSRGLGQNGFALMLMATLFAWHMAWLSRNTKAWIFRMKTGQS